MATVQLNVRIDADLKAAGDAVLERFGVSSVQIVRSAWQYMADHQKLPSFAVEDDTGAGDQAAYEAGAGGGMAIRLAREAGLRAELDAMSYKELRESAFEEMVLENAECQTAEETGRFGIDMAARNPAERAGRHA